MVVLLFFFRLLLAPPVEDEAKTHHMHCFLTKLADTKVKDIENRSQNGSAKLDQFSIGVPADSVPEQTGLINLGLFSEFN